MTCFWATYGSPAPSPALRRGPVRIMVSHYDSAVPAWHAQSHARLCRGRDQLVLSSFLLLLLPLLVVSLCVPCAFVFSFLFLRFLFSLLPAPSSFLPPLSFLPRPSPSSPLSRSVFSPSPASFFAPFRFVSVRPFFGCRLGCCWSCLLGRSAGLLSSPLLACSLLPQVGPLDVH